MSSFNVRPDRSIAYFGWLPGGAGAGVNLSCPAAEQLRERLFMGQGVTQQDLQAALAEPDPLRKERDLLARRVQELQTVTTLDALKTLGRLLLDEGAKYQAAYVCLTSETGIGGLACAAVMAKIVQQGYTLWQTASQGGIGAARAGAVAELNAQIAVLDKAIAAGKPKRRSLADAVALLQTAQVGLCTEVRKSCLQP